VHGQLRATWLGVSTVLLDDGETAVLTDGFFSRPGPVRVLLGRVRPDRRRILAALTRAGIDRLAAVFVVHSHYDHALDAATVAELTGARLLGSASTRHIARGHGFPLDRFDEVALGEPVSFGAFLLTALPARHTPGDLSPGRIDAPVRPAARARDYRTGECFSLHVRHGDDAVVVHASTHFLPGALAGKRADVVFLGIALLTRQDEDFRDAYWRETVTATGARRVVPVHWDDFTRPLDRPLRAIPHPLDDVPRSLAWLQARADVEGVELVRPRPFEAIPVGADRPGGR
jgi:L-ascorbate metabolism protein UlaG (beta-lactamase superfamily)